MERCTGCNNCVVACPVNALELFTLDPVTKEKIYQVQDGVARSLDFKAELCAGCGFCIKPCPFHIIQGAPSEYRITVGGHRGRHPKIGRHLIDVKTPEDVVRVVDKVIYWIYRQASTGALLPEQLDELEFDEFKKTIVKMIEG